MLTLPAKLDAAIPNCELCGARLIYRGVPVHYHILVSYGSIKCCDGCYEENGQCWSPATQKMLLKLLCDRDLPIPNLNSEGLLPKK